MIAPYTLSKYIILAIFVLLFSCQNEQATKEVADNEFDAKTTLSSIAENYKQVIDFPLDSGNIPRSLEPNGETRGVVSRNWCSGFYPGIWWMLYAHTQDETFAKEAEEWTWLIEKEKDNVYTHDLGFMIYDSFGWGYQLTKRKDFEAVIVQGAKSLSTRFNPTISAIRSWDTPEGHKWQYPIIIDNMMNLELLFTATEISGDSSFYHIAVNHAETTLKNHFREDNSSFHVVDYDITSGAPRKKETHQGINDASAWARGQGWGLYGYTVMYRITKDAKYLNQANKIASYIIKRLPKDYIPYWDFDAPNIPNEPRDTSAGALIASALLELQDYVQGDTKETYTNVAKELLKELSSERYRREATLEAPFILNHATGNYPANDEIDVPIVYADYYYVEALLRASKLKVLL